MLVLLLLLGVAGGAVGGERAWAQQASRRLWYQAYDDGLRAVEAGQWQAAIESLEQSRQGAPAPARRVLFYGDRVDAFNPDYYLGLAYLEAGRPQEAAAAFARVRQAGLVRSGDRLYEAFVTQSTRAAFEVALQGAEQRLAAGDLDGARAAAAEAARLGTSPARIQAFNQQLEQRATAALVAPQASPGAAAPRAGDASASAAGADAPGPRPAPPASGSQPAVTAPPAAAASPAELPAPSAAPPPAPSAASTAAPRPDAAVTPPAPPAEAVKAAPLTPPQRASAPVDAVIAGSSERAAVAAFLRGNYAAAESALREVVRGQARSPLAQFYYACSLAALVVTGERDASALLEARQALERAGSLDRFARDQQYISPRILAALEVAP
ncbi:MAG: hypothetical protein AB7G23_06160 [Vicinamibacterales bacterium]